MTVSLAEARVVPKSNGGFNLHGVKRGYVGVGVWHVKHEINVGSLVRAAAVFGADFVFTIGRRYRPSAAGRSLDRHVPVFHYEDLDQYLAVTPGAARHVLVEIHPRARPLESFTHPHQAIYLLGAEDHGLPDSVLDRMPFASVVQLPGAVCMNGASAGSVLLYDRHLKGSPHA
jgi:tRNA(Leu) C34 or U34 (ribose-2'-O)-methylase TrmL